MRITEVLTGICLRPSLMLFNAPLLGKLLCEHMVSNAGLKHMHEVHPDIVVITRMQNGQESYTDRYRDIKHR